MIIHIHIEEYLTLAKIGFYNVTIERRLCSHDTYRTQFWPFLQDRMSSEHCRKIIDLIDLDRADPFLKINSKIKSRKFPAASNRIFHPAEKVKIGSCNELISFWNFMQTKIPQISCSDLQDLVKMRPFGNRNIQWTRELSCLVSNSLRLFSWSSVISWMAHVLECWTLSWEARVRSPVASRLFLFFGQ